MQLVKQQIFYKTKRRAVRENHLVISLAEAELR
jgi:hypothetical protein